MSTTKRVGENAESKPLNLRLPHAVSDRLEALATDLPIVSKHRLAVEALRLGLAIIEADPGILLRSAASPSTPRPATPGAPAPVRPVASPVAPVEAPAVDPRQLPLLAPAAPVVALHNTANGASVATITGNDNATSPAQPKPVEAPLPDIDLDALKVRVRAAIAAKHSERSICTAAGLSESALNAWLNRPGRGLRQETARKVDPVLRGLRF